MGRGWRRLIWASCLSARRPQPGRGTGGQAPRSQGSWGPLGRLRGGRRPWWGEGGRSRGPSWLQVTTEQKHPQSQWLFFLKGEGVWTPCPSMRGPACVPGPRACAWLQPSGGDARAPSGSTGSTNLPFETHSEPPLAGSLPDFPRLSQAFCLVPSSSLVGLSSRGVKKELKKQVADP